MPSLHGTSLVCACLSLVWIVFRMGIKGFGLWERLRMYDNLPSLLLIAKCLHGKGCMFREEILHCAITYPRQSYVRVLAEALAWILSRVSFLAASFRNF